MSVKFSGPECDAINNYKGYSFSPNEREALEKIATDTFKEEAGTAAKNASQRAKDTIDNYNGYSLSQAEEAALRSAFSEGLSPLAKDVVEIGGKKK